MPEYTGDMWIYGFDITQNKSSFLYVQDKDLSGLCWGNHSRRRKDYISHFLCLTHSYWTVVIWTSSLNNYY